MAVASSVDELDEMYWFVKKKPRTETRENTYITTLVRRNPRQIMGADAAMDRSPARVQRIVDNTPVAQMYCTDGWSGYIDVVYPGQHIRNTRDKSDALTVEGINADLRHNIPGLARQSRCFYRRLETSNAVLAPFVYAYNKLGQAKASASTVDLRFGQRPLKSARGTLSQNRAVSKTDNMHKPVQDTMLPAHH